MHLPLFQETPFYNIQSKKASPPLYYYFWPSLDMGVDRMGIGRDGRWPQLEKRRVWSGYDLGIYKTWTVDSGLDHGLTTIQALIN